MGYSLDQTYNLTIKMYRCPNCMKITSLANYVGSEMPEKTIPIYPQSLAKHFPEYVPQFIRDDYEEAYSILQLSPKASATLSRRCIQGMIRDYWKISKSTLYQEIDALKDKIDPLLWKTIDSVRKIGNIGAHMEKDVNSIIDIDSDEAEKLIKLIEILIKEWYINSYERSQLFSDIIAINDQKQAERKESK